MTARNVRSLEGRRARTRAMMLVISALSIMAALIAMCLGAARLPLGKVVGAIGGALRGEAADTASTIVLGVRLPRVIASYLVGAALSVCGACMQGLFRNPMADPHLLGVSSGAALGVAVCSVLPKTSAAFLVWLAIVAIVPSALHAVGMVVEPVGALASWLPYNFFSNEVAINQSGLAEFLWDTPAGLAKCLIAGFAGVAVFGIAGLWRASKTEL